MFASLDRIILKPAADKNLLNVIGMANLKLNGGNEENKLSILAFLKYCEMGKIRPPLHIHIYSHSVYSVNQLMVAVECG